MVAWTSYYVEFFKMLGIIDYSLLIGIHDRYKNDPDGI